jgi:hypothetical protein
VVVVVDLDDRGDAKSSASRPRSLAVLDVMKLRTIITDAQYAQAEGSVADAF